MHGMAKLNDILCMQRKLCSVKCIVTKKKVVCASTILCRQGQRVKLEATWSLTAITPHCT